MGQRNAAATTGGVMPLIEPDSLSEYDPDLFAAARTGSRLALEQLLEEFRPYLEALADQQLIAVGRGTEGAADLVQETMAEARRLFPGFVGESTDALRDWLGAILQNKAAALLGGGLREVRLPTSSGEFNLDALEPVDSLNDDLADDLAGPGVAAPQQLQDRLLYILARMPGFYLDVIRLRNWNDLSFTEVASRIGRSEEATRMQWARAIERLRRAMVAEVDQDTIPTVSNEDRQFADLLAAYDETLAGRGDMSGILGPMRVSDAVSARLEEAREIVRLIRNVAPHMPFPMPASPMLDETAPTVPAHRLSTASVAAADLLLTPAPVPPQVAPLLSTTLPPQASAPLSPEFTQVPVAAPTVVTPPPIAPSSLHPPPSPRSEPLADLAPQTSFAGRYVIEREVGRGALTTVYEALDMQRSRRVALTLYQLDAGHDIKWFRRVQSEALVLAELKGPHLVELFDAGIADDQPYAVEEFVEGPTLEFAMRHLPQHPHVAASCVAYLARAIHEAHKRDMLHLDLRTSNVLLAPAPVGGTSQGAPPGAIILSTNDSPWIPKLKGFGLALNASELTELGQSAAQFGTPAYMAPEQLTDRDDLVGPSTDVYALGAILYEMITARPPFQGVDVADTVEQVTETDLVAPSRFQPKIGRDLETICLHCLKKWAFDRYATAGQLADELERYLAGQPIQARRPSLMTRGWDWKRRHPRAARIVTTVFVIGVTCFISGLMLWLQARRQVATALVDVRQANDRAYFADMVFVQRAWDEHNPTRLRELLDNQLPERTDGIDRRGFEWYYWRRLGTGEQRTIQVPGPKGTQVYCSANSKTYISVTPTQVITIWDRESQQPLQSFPAPDERILNAGSSADGRMLATAAPDFTVKLWDATSGKNLRTLKGHTASITSIVFSRDGQMLASASADQSVRVWEAATGRLLQTLGGHAQPVACVAFSPNGQLLAGGTQDGVTRVWTVSTGQEKSVLAGHRGPVLSVNWSADSRRVGTASGDRTAKIWDASSGKETATLSGHTAAVRDIGFSPDGRRAATGSPDQTVRIWNADNGVEIAVLPGQAESIVAVYFTADGQRLFAIGTDQTIKEWQAQLGDETLALPQGASCRNVAFSPDGRFLACATADSTIVWDVASRQVRHTLARSGGGMTCLSFSPNSQRLAAATEDRTVRIWDVASGQEGRALRGHQGPVLGVCFSPDGQRIATGSLDKTVIIWDAEGGQSIRTINAHTREVTSVSFSPDGKRLASASNDSSVKIWDAATGQELATLQGHSQAVLSVSFSPDGTRLASASSDRSVLVWDAKSFEQLFALKGHNGIVTQVAYSSDSKRLVTSSFDQSVRIWDAGMGYELLDLKGHRGKVNSAVFSADGRIIASGGADQAVKLWLALRD